MNLHLLQLGDSALPVGGYSHSWGLEAAVAVGLVRGAEDLESWVRFWLRQVIWPLEGIIVAAGCSALPSGNGEMLAAANELLWTSVSPPTLRTASAEMGEQLTALAEGWPWAIHAVELLSRVAARPGMRAWHFAVVFGALAAAAGAHADEALALFLHQSALAVIIAGVRGIPIGHTHGQQILARLHDELCQLARQPRGDGLSQAGGFSPAYEALCHAQSTLYTRIFRS